MNGDSEISAAIELLPRAFVRHQQDASLQQNDSMLENHEQQPAIPPLQSPTTQPLPTTGTGPGVRMIALEEHEEIIKRMTDEHDVVVKRLEGEIDRLKALLRNNSTNANGGPNKQKNEDKLQRVDARGNNKRMRTQSTTNKHDAKWQVRYDELKTFQETHGHCNVLQNDESFKELRKW